MIKASILCLAAFGLMLSSNDDKKSEVNLKGIKCIMMGKVNAKEQNAVDFMDGKVYLCCKRCVAGFKKNSEKHGDKARHQLAATKQYVQKGCPFSGGAVKDGQTCKVGGVEVGFCCGGCKGKVEGKEKLKDKVAMVFGKDAFEKGYKKAESKK